MTVLAPGDVARNMRKLLGGRMVDLPGKPSLDKRDLYLRLVKIEKVYPDRAVAHVKPIQHVSNRDFDAYPSRLSFPFFSSQAILSCIPEGKAGIDRYGRYIIPPEDVFAVAMAVEGDRDRKGDYILGFVKMDDQLIAESGNLESGWTIEYGGLRVRLDPEQNIIELRNGETRIIVHADRVEIEGKLVLNGKEISP